MERFRKIIENRHEYAREWKVRTGGKIFGYYETYMPEEIVYAAGILPVRLLAKHMPDDITDRPMYGSCYVARDILNQMLNGTYDYVDGIVNAEGCQWMFNSFEVACNDLPHLFNHYVFVPDYPDARTSKVVLRSELEVFKKHIEEWGGVEITTEALDNAIEVYNTNRRLLRRIYELRRVEHPVLLGSEAMELVLACQLMDKAEANRMLEKLIPELEAREPKPDAVRILLLGSETYDVELEKMIEASGGNVVIDELDNGTSYFWNEVIPQEDRLLAITFRYLGRPHSALKDNNWRRRPDHIWRLYEDYGADCAIIGKQIYCHPHGTDNYMVWKLLRERNIPYHFFERDTSLPQEETLARVEAFINMVKPGITRLFGWNQVADF